VITGSGTIYGRRVCVAVEDFTVMGGTLGESHCKKICRTIELAMSIGAPVIFIYDSGGARIEEGVAALNACGELFRWHTKASGVIPQIAVIAGPCSGGASYGPSLCDFVFMVDGIGQMFVTGPKVTKTVLPDDALDYVSGSAYIHSHDSGVSHFTYSTEADCYSEVKRLLSFFDEGRKDPLASILAEGRGMELRNIVPINHKYTYDMHKVIENLADDQSIMEVQRDFARNIIIAFCRFNGQTVGLIANQPSHIAGALDCDAAVKASRFIRFCDCNDIPLVTLVDVPAFLPNFEEERKGILRHGAKLLYAYSDATVPKITVVIRKAYGGAYVAMGSKSLGADAVFAWPTALISVMGGDGAMNMIAHKYEKTEQATKTREEMMEEYKEKCMDPMIAAKRGIVDDIIMPEETRGRICAQLDFLKEKRNIHSSRKHGNMPL